MAQKRMSLDILSIEYFWNTLKQYRSVDFLFCEELYYVKFSKAFDISVTYPSETLTSWLDSQTENIKLSADSD